MSLNDSKIRSLKPTSKSHKTNNGGFNSFPTNEKKCECRSLLPMRLFHAHSTAL